VQLLRNPTSIRVCGAALVSVAPTWSVHSHFISFSRKQYCKPFCSQAGGITIINSRTQRLKYTLFARTQALSRFHCLFNTATILCFDVPVLRGFVRSVSCAEHSPFKSFSKKLRDESPSFVAFDYLRSFNNCFVCFALKTISKIYKKIVFNE